MCENTLQLWNNKIISVETSKWLLRFKSMIGQDQMSDFDIPNLFQMVNSLFLGP